MLNIHHRNEGEPTDQNKDPCGNFSAILGSSEIYEEFMLDKTSRHVSNGN